MRPWCAIGRRSSSPPTVPEAHNNLAAALYELGRLDEAIASDRCAVALRPCHGAASRPCSSEFRRPSCCRRPLALRPDLAEIHENWERCSPR